jgi:hypothetical protein
LYPDEIDDINSIDPFQELMPLNIAKVYLILENGTGTEYIKCSNRFKFKEGDKNHRNAFGYLPTMARSYLGNNMSESICERVLSVAGNVMNKGNTLLSDNCVSSVSQLRMNKAFMIYARSKYGDAVRKELTSQGRNMSLVNMSPAAKPVVKPAQASKVTDYFDRSHDNGRRAPTAKQTREAAIATQERYRQNEKAANRRNRKQREQARKERQQAKHVKKSSSSSETSPPRHRTHKRISSWPASQHASQLPDKQGVS